MPKYLVQASYTAEGLKGLQKDKGSGRRAAVDKALQPLGGRIEAWYYAFGEYDLATIVDLPDNVTAARLSLGVSATGLVHTRTTPLLTVEEVDRALQEGLEYRAPGR